MKSGGDVWEFGTEQKLYKMFALQESGKHPANDLSGRRWLALVRASPAQNQSATDNSITSWHGAGGQRGEQAPVPRKVPMAGRLAAPKALREMLGGPEKRGREHPGCFASSSRGGRHSRPRSAAPLAPGGPPLRRGFGSDSASPNAPACWGTTKRRLKTETREAAAAAKPESPRGQPWGRPGPHRATEPAPTAFQQLAPKARRLRLLPLGVPPHLRLGLHSGPHHGRARRTLGPNTTTPRRPSDSSRLCCRCACAPRGGGGACGPLPQTRFLNEEDGWEMESSAFSLLVRDPETLLAVGSSVAPAQSRRGAGTPRSKGDRHSPEADFSEAVGASWQVMAPPVA